MNIWKNKINKERKKKNAKLIFKNDVIFKIRGLEIYLTDIFPFDGLWPLIAYQSSNLVARSIKIRYNIFSV